MIQTRLGRERRSILGDCQLAKATVLRTFVSQPHVTSSGIFLFVAEISSHGTG